MFQARQEGPESFLDSAGAGAVHRVPDRRGERGSGGRGHRSDADVTQGRHASRASR
jgi:hypothetical protein